MTRANLMTRSNLILLAAGSSGALLIAALASQYIGGLAPCELCIWQRWPHLAAVVLGGVGLATAGPTVPLLGAATSLGGSGIGLYHTGVERGWWDGPAACGAPGGIEGLTAEELLAQIMAAPVVRCDEVAWEFLSLSMASWNALASLGLAGIWALAALRRGGQRR